ncbi:MAG TPA: DUF4260 domain-containing protein [Rhizomicrobium sp.]|nr:DUF4260 domain-containing protein [Rhizomicrobium sp.]
MATGGVKTLLQFEGLAMLAASAGLYRHIGGDWKLFALLILVPDVAFLGYLFGPRVGAIGYNIMHAMIGPLLLAGWGVMSDSHIAIAVSLIWMAHIGFDRAIGAGLKYATGFGDTHINHKSRMKMAAEAA